MKKLNIFSLIIILFSLYSCNQVIYESYKTITSFPIEQLIFGEDMAFPLETKSIGLADSLIVMVTENLELMVNLYDPNTGKLVSQFGRKGKGPAEFITQPKYFNGFEYIDNELHLWLLDLNKRTFHLYNASNKTNDSTRVAQKISLIYEILPEFSLFHIANDIVVGTKGGSIGSNFKYNPILGEIEIFDFYPQLPNKGQRSSGNPFACNSTINKKKSRIASAYYYFNIIDISSFDGDRIISIKTDDEGFDDITNQLEIKELKSGKRAFFEIFSTENYIYALFNNCLFDDYVNGDFESQLLVFDWDGRPIARFKTNSPLDGFVVDQNDKILYGNHYYSAGSISKFTLPFMFIQE